MTSNLPIQNEVELFCTWNDYVNTELINEKSRDEIIWFLTKYNRMSLSQAEAFFDPSYVKRMKSREKEGRVVFLVLFFIKLLLGIFLCVKIFIGGYIEYTGPLVILFAFYWLDRYRNG